MGIFFVVLVACVCVFCACFFQGCEKKPVPTVKTSTTTVESVKSMSRSEIEIMLKTLKPKKTPKQVVSASCYVPLPVLNKSEYVCPLCGEKTIYSSAMLDSTRDEFAKLKKISKLKVELDESRLCKKCYPDLKIPEFVLKITYADGTIYERKSPALFFELQLLVDCFEGYGTPDSPQLRELLGLENSKKAK